MIPMNLMTKNGKADFVITGQWATKAQKEAARYGEANIVASSKDKTFSYIPDLDPSTFSKDADYFHICYNNTIYGTKYTKLPETGDVPLVADISSCILSEPIDVSKFGLLYAGAQKNMGPAGLTVVIVREDLIGEPMDKTPTMFTYKTHAENDSLYNTPPCYSIYMCMLVLEWIKNDIGGLAKMKELNEKKAKILYDFLDQSQLFKEPKAAAIAEYVSVPEEDTTCVVKVELFPPPCSAWRTRARSNTRASIWVYLLSGLSRCKIFSAVDRCGCGA